MELSKCVGVRLVGRRTHPDGHNLAEISRDHVTRILTPKLETIIRRTGNLLGVREFRLWSTFPQAKTKRLRSESVKVEGIPHKYTLFDG